MTAPALVDLIPPSLMRRLEQRAAAERRTARDVVGDALDRYLRDAPVIQQDVADDISTLDAGEAVERIFALRRGNILPDGVTIEDLQAFGRK